MKYLQEDQKVRESRPIPLQDKIGDQYVLSFRKVTNNDQSDGFHSNEKIPQAVFICEYVILQAHHDRHAESDKFTIIIPHSTEYCRKLL